MSAAAAEQHAGADSGVGMRSRRGAWSQGLDELIAVDATTFIRPIVHSLSTEKPLVKLYLNAAPRRPRGEHFRYVGEWCGENSAVLEFLTRIDEIGDRRRRPDWLNAHGKIVRLQRLMIRPLKAIQIVHQKMGAMLARCNSSSSKGQTLSATDAQLRRNRNEPAAHRRLLFGK